MIGDIASLAGPDGKPLPGPGDGRDPAGAARRRRRSAAASPAPSTPFRYLDKGALAVIGRGQGDLRDQGPRSSPAGRRSPPTSACTSTTSAATRAGASSVLIDWVTARIGDRGDQVIEGELSSVERAPPTATRPTLSRTSYPIALASSSAGAEPDGVHAGVPHRPRLARRGLPGDDADRQLHRAAPRRRRRAAARAALVEGRGGDVRGRRGHRHRAVVRVRPPVAGVHRAASATSSGSCSRSRGSSSSSRRSSSRSTSSAGSACPGGRTSGPACRS